MGVCEWVVGLSKNFEKNYLWLLGKILPKYVRGLGARKACKKYRQTIKIQILAIGLV